MADEPAGVREQFREFFALERDVLVLSIAMFAFSLAYQMTGRYIPEYLSALGAGSVTIGLYGSAGNLLSAVYPYPGGALSDRVGSRSALTAFGLASTLGFLIWFSAPALTVFPIPEWGWVFIGLLLVQAWESFGIGATFAIVKQSATDRLATGFASTETVRRVGFLVGPLLATAALAATGSFLLGFRWVLALAVGFGALATIVQHYHYDSTGDTMGKTFAGLNGIREDLRNLPEPLRPLLVGDTLVRFANGMVYVFFVIVVTDFLAVSVDLPVMGFLAPAAFFGVLLAVEMAIALLTMVPVAKLAERFGLKPVVALGFAVYAVFPALLISAPANALVTTLLFAVSGLRFAGLPAHKALIVGPAAANAGGRVVGSYYLVRNALTIPSAAFGGWLYGASPPLAFGLATVVGLLGTGYFLAFGEGFTVDG